ncbi:unnamed protein product [Phytophthora fragariaefolia]|uniref:Unnamed protein product n=1 Tax=Phytophthora fragariaefolia TaxID=1490495 RepID=A0A9W6U8C3_9STRA|nr:unnamed protein product [Phytophthora fragariaefolia]
MKRTTGLKTYLGLLGRCLTATSNLKGKEKKEHEAKKIEALGGKAAKSRSVPYKMLIGMKTKGAAKKQRREELEADVVTGKRKSTGKSRDQQKRKKVDFGVQATKGRFKGGVLDVRGLYCRDDYMLGEKGDRIVHQMDELVKDDNLLAERDVKPRLQDPPRDDMKSNANEEKTSFDLGTMISMEDIEKYIAEN